VGTTQNFTVRLAQHVSGVNSAAWVVLHGYDSTVRTFAYQNKLDEDHHTKKMMIKYGRENVRGGSYSNVKLTEIQIKTLDREFAHARNECLNCGSKRHYAKDCPVGTKKVKVVTKSKPCTRCGRTGHTKVKCFAKTLLCGTNILDLKYCSRCGREDHSDNRYTGFTCIYKTDRARVKIASCTFCVKCGRDNHTLEKCCAKTRHTGRLF
jgi:hypothetical protein